MRPATLIATLALAAALPGAAAAAPSACPEHYPGGLAPDILRPTLAERARELCFRGYAVLHSGISRTALAAAEHLTRERVQAARVATPPGLWGVWGWCDWMRGQDLNL